jgi:hypothetical protein
MAAGNTAMAAGGGHPKLGDIDDDRLGVVGECLEQAALD